MILGIAIIVGGNVQAFLDKTITRISEGKRAIETGGTQFIQKT